jgi:hypothetical protein
MADIAGTNGKAPCGAYCAAQDERIEMLEVGARDTDKRVYGHDAAYGKILSKLGEFEDVANKGYQASLASATASSDVKQALNDYRLQQRRECDLRHEHLRPSREDLPYDPDENTLHGKESPELAASLWKARNAESIERETKLREQLAAAQATIDATNAERERQSIRAEKAEDRRWTNRQKAGAIVVSVIVALGGLAGLAQLLK